MHNPQGYLKPVSAAYRNPPPPICMPASQSRKSFRSPGQVVGNFEEDPIDKSNIITEWQAGWNVTNAIQASHFSSFHAH
ncbi:hypothetical protein Ciccas_007065 [Cichlidogyrus casuarinus]|uniref:Uncharacterized protein n=1 Tax=Cichlidogyrus casuarinus TaxID=1844966 RepID=A0ABD2Q3X5_9PLAT